MKANDTLSVPVLTCAMMLDSGISSEAVNKLLANEMPQKDADEFYKLIASYRAHNLKTLLRLSGKYKDSLLD